MKTRLTVMFAALCCLATFAAFSADAQSDRRLAFQVPFDFFVQGRRLPAGRYTVERLNQSDPGVLVLKDVNSPKRQVFSTQRAEAGKVGNLSKLVFMRYGDEHFLSNIWWDGDPNGRRLPRSDAEREWDGRGVEPTIIALTRK